MIHYDSDSDSTIVLCRPQTGRTHQIRIHLQYLGHPIANDPNYGGNMWYHNPQGQDACRQAQAMLDSEDGAVDVNVEAIPTLARVTSAEPATEAEVNRAAQLLRDNTETMDEFIRRTCVWCARNRSGRDDRAALELLVRSSGIWLHALQYSIIQDNKTIVFRTELPGWCMHDPRISNN